jgi:hypothetical protein
MFTLKVEGKKLWNHGFIREFNKPNGIHKAQEWKKQVRSTQALKRIMFK